MARTRRTYSDDQRAEALALYAEAGPTEVQIQLGIPKATVTAWAKAANVGTVRNEKIAAAVEAASLDHAARREALVERLTVVAEQAVEHELRLLEDSDLRDVVGARTRAIHDLLLLTGQATSRTETVGSDVDDEIRRLTAELALNDDRAAA